MASRISPIVVMANATRTTVQVTVVGGLALGAFALLANFGYRFDTVVRFVNEALVRFVTG